MNKQQQQSTHKSDVDQALLVLTHGRCIYEKARMSGEQRHRLHLLPVDTLAEKTDCCSDATDSLYADSLTSILPHDGSKHHSIYDNTRMSGEQVRRHELPVNRLAERRDLGSDATDHAYLRSLRNDDVFAHEITNHSIYDATRMSGEQRHPHPLPVNVAAERSDCCTDADDSKYLNCLTNMFLTSKASRL